MPLAVVVQGFFLGMVANLFPLAPAGVGAVDAGMIGAFVLFGLPEDTVFPAILIFRLISFWMPIPPGVVAFFQLRNTVHQLGRRRRADRPRRQRRVRPRAGGRMIRGRSGSGLHKGLEGRTIKSKVKSRNRSKAKRNG